MKNGRYVHETPPGDSPATFAITVVAVAKSGERNKIQHTHTNAYVSAHPPMRPASDGDVSTAEPRCRCHSLWPASASPCSRPHTTNVDRAPCHRPPSTMVISRFRYILRTPRRLPPSEMY